MTESSDIHPLPGLRPVPPEAIKERKRKPRPPQLPATPAKLANGVPDEPPLLDEYA